MTVIVWDGSTLAMNNMCYIGDQAYHRINMRKVMSRDGEEYVVAYTGVVSVGEEMVSWFTGKTDNYPKAMASNTVLNANLLCVPIGEPPRPLLFYGEAYIPVELPYDRPFTTGDGQDVAIGALYAGADAVLAASAASRLRPWCAATKIVVCHLGDGYLSAIPYITPPYPADSATVCPGEGKQAILGEVPIAESPTAGFTWFGVGGG